MTTENIETQGLAYPRFIPLSYCELCDRESVMMDKEWIDVGKWRKTYWCPSCGRETSGTTRVTASLGIGTEKRVKYIAREYIKSDVMSEAALERSLDRLYGLDG